MSEKMHGLVCLNEGFSGTAEGPSIESLDPYLEYRELDVPTPGPGKALVKVAMASINPSDLHFIKGEYGIARRQGVPAGFEAVGEVVAAGEGAEGLIGKRVSCFGDVSGAWADYAVADMATCIPVRPDVRDEDAAALLVNPMTAIAMYDEATRDGDAFIMTAAASQLCKLMAGLAKLDGKQAISVVRREEQVEAIKQYGASYVFNSTAEDFAASIGAVIKELKPRAMLDAVADLTSSKIFTAMPSQARWIVYGKLSTELPVIEQAGQLIFMRKSIEGFWLTQWMKEKPAEEQIKAGMRVQELFASGEWKTDIAGVVKLSEAHAKLPNLLAGANQGKVMLVPG